ncbi:type IX secretion system periplasmic lipoprotein PorW/SprE [Flavobacterium haoranii]|uniref:Protein involved in gliding motility SprE n=1 Tax=Flavobacterium haoranii TaxID=683124 RepID=A0A1M6E014_9FLAO|nr:tetratricopeptide repeat protein [Flavobacterium haoranii]SHI78864.1 protein involved in gliding motility SprE [Flavobacterium haoranii]
MKKTLYKYLFVTAIVFTVIACSVKKDRFLNRSFHSVTTEYNILYNGNLAMETGLTELVATYNDNFWDVLPVERMPDKEESILPGQTKNTNFERAEEKAVKAIQKHSMNIGGLEKNPQMDEAYLLLGKARYYDNRFIPALEALNYILYKYPNSDKIYHAKVWREKVNIRIDNNETAIKNLKKLLDNEKIDGQDLADANAMLTQAYLNIEATDSAVATLKISKTFTKNKEEKARYTFILGQLYEKMNYADSAFTTFQEVIDLKRKSPRRYVIQAHAKQAAQFDYKNGDTIAFLEKFNKLIADRENRPYLNILYHQKGIFYDKFEQDSLAKRFYNLSNKLQSQDQYLVASNYRNIGEINFRNAKYKTAGAYYDSTLLRLDDKTREYRKIKKKRDNLVDVIYYEDIAKQNDSILSIVAMNDEGKKAYFENYILKLKKEDERKAKLAAEKAEKEANKEANLAGGNNPNPSFNPNPNAIKMQGMLPPMGGNDLASSSNFYFYNPSTVSYGKIEFKKKWGNRKYKENWRQLKGGEDFSDNDFAENDTINEEKEEIVENPAYTTDFYISQLPTDQKIIDSLGRDRNDAYYQLGLIYKEKFKEYELAANRLEQLLKNNPEERLILPAKYNLFKIYEILKSDKALVYKNDIITNYPDSRYAQIVQNPSVVLEDEENPELYFSKLYKKYESGDIRFAYNEVNQKTIDYFGDEMMPKYELLKAKVLARTNGLESYKSALNYVALTYPNNEEGKQAQEILDNDVPKLEALEFTTEDKRSWKLIFPKTYVEGENYEKLTKVLNKYIEDSHNTDLKVSVDLYNLENDFVVMHGFLSKESANVALTLLKEYKDYKIKDTAYSISSENYMIVQAKKQFEDWLIKNK